MGKREEVRKKLEGISESAYKEFNDRLLNAPDMPTLGIRIPKLRELAKSMAKEGCEEWMREMKEAACADMVQEEHMLLGMVIGYGEYTDEERARLLDGWIPRIVSWADCDCCVSTFKHMKKNQEFWFAYVEKWLESKKEFELRFAVVALLDFFINDGYIDRVLKALEEVRQEAYYVRMGAAWALSVCYVKYPQKTFALFEKQTLDKWTHNKAIQKCRESFRVSAEDKEKLSAMKRK